MFRSGKTTLIISNEEMNDVMKIVKSSEDSGLLTHIVSETIKNEAKKQKGMFLSIFLGLLTLIWVAFLGVRFEVGRRVKVTPPLPHHLV